MRRLTLALVLLAVLVLAWVAFDRPPRPSDGPQNPVQGEERPISKDEELPAGFSEETIERLETWFRTVEASASRSGKITIRDIFRKGGEPLRAMPPPTKTPERSVEVVLPRLTGFVLEGTRNGPVAAIRYEGRMWLVEVGDTVGPYRVEKLIAGEEVLLVEVVSGEELKLELQ